MMLGLIAAMYLSRRRGRFDCGESLQKAVGVLGSCWYHPRVARFQPHGLPLDHQFRPSGDDVADHLIFMFMAGLVLSWGLIPLQPDGHSFA